MCPLASPWPVETWSFGSSSRRRRATRGRWASRAVALVAAAAATAACGALGSTQPDTVSRDTHGFGEIECAPWLASKTDREFGGDFREAWAITRDTCEGYQSAWWQLYDARASLSQMTQRFCWEKYGASVDAADQSSLEECMLALGPTASSLEKVMHQLDQLYSRYGCHACCALTRPNSRDCWARAIGP